MVGSHSPLSGTSCVLTSVVIFLRDCEFFLASGRYRAAWCMPACVLLPAEQMPFPDVICLFQLTVFERAGLSAPRPAIDELVAFRLHVACLPEVTSLMARTTKRRAVTEAPSAIGFRHVLVPTDLTDRPAKAFDLALRLARRDGSRITLLHVIQVIPGISREELEPFYKKLETRASAKMTQLAGRAPRDIAVRVEIAYGARAESIVSVARKRRVDLIVLASHRVNPVMIGRDWGTISYKVGILAPCPVLLMK